jgi:XTP/dITP diphosphohydrolase
MKDLIIATRNRGKYEEIVSIISENDSNIHNYNFIFAGDINDLPQIKETGKTLNENALIKAKTVADLMNKPCIADDTGLYVESLFGSPGIYAAMFAGFGCTDDDNIIKLISEMDKHENRAAHFKTVCVYYDPEIKQSSQGIGTLAGHISTEKRGDNGFGYDPVFIPTGDIKTLAEMTNDEKNNISHRRKAIQNLLKLMTI